MIMIVSAPLARLATGAHAYISAQTRCYILDTTTTANSWQPGIEARSRSALAGKNSSLHTTMKRPHETKAAVHYHNVLSGARDETREVHKKKKKNVVLSRNQPRSDHQVLRFTHPYLSMPLLLGEAHACAVQRPLVVPGGTQTAVPNKKRKTRNVVHECTRKAGRLLSIGTCTFGGDEEKEGEKEQTAQRTASHTASGYRRHAGEGRRPRHALRCPKHGILRRIRCLVMYKYLV